MNPNLPKGLLLEEYQFLRLKKSPKSIIDTLCEKTNLTVTLVLEGDNIISMKCDAWIDGGSCRSPNGPVNEEGKTMCNIDINKK